MEKIKRVHKLMIAGGLLGLIYVIFFSGLFSTPEIRLVSRQGVSEIGTKAILFGMDKPYQLTLIRVERVGGDGEQSEEMWSLVGSPRSEPTEAFRYGQGFEGMTVAEKGKWRKSLKAGETYRLIVKAGRARGEHVFMIEADAEAQAAR